MDAKRKATLDELIGEPEESEEEKKDPEMLDLEEPKRHMLLKISLFVFVVVILIALGYTAYLAYTGSQKVSNEEKIENTAGPDKDTSVATPTTPEFVYVDATDGLNLRETASATAKVVTILPNHAKLIVISEENSWYKVTYNTQSGYVRTDFTIKALPPAN